MVLPFIEKAFVSTQVWTGRGKKETISFQADWMEPLVLGYLCKRQRRVYRVGAKNVPLILVGEQI